MCIPPVGPVVGAQAHDINLGLLVPIFTDFEVGPDLASRHIPSKQLPMNESN